MAFWTTVGGNTKDPKRGFRFKVLFNGYNADQSGVLWFAKKVSKPNFTITESKHSFMNHNFYYPGRVEWQEISLTLVDPISPGAVAQTNAIIQASGYKIPSTAEQLETMSKGKTLTSTGVIQIIQIDADGNAVETWTLKQPWIKSVKFGELAYDSDDLIEIELGLRYDWAECTFPATAAANVDVIPNAGALDPTKFFSTSS